jgi:hypothetical protein
MKKIAVCIGAVVVIAALSCDPIGTEETKVWVTGIIYEDSLLGDGLEGAMLMLEMLPDTFNVSSSDVMTDVNGRFMMEIQVYPDLPDEGSTGYSMPSLIFFGLSAHYGSWNYIYRSLDNPFIVGIGDTLYVWPVTYGSGS